MKTPFLILILFSFFLSQSVHAASCSDTLADCNSFIFAEPGSCLTQSIAPGQFSVLYTYKVLYGGGGNHFYGTCQSQICDSPSTTTLGGITTFRQCTSSASGSGCDCKEMSCNSSLANLESKTCGQQCKDGSTANMSLSDVGTNAPSPCSARDKAFDDAAAQAAADAARNAAKQAARDAAAAKQAKQDNPFKSDSYRESSSGLSSPGTSGGSGSGSTGGGGTGNTGGGTTGGTVNPSYNPPAPQYPQNQGVPFDCYDGTWRYGSACPNDPVEAFLNRNPILPNPHLSFDDWKKRFYELDPLSLLVGATRIDRVKFLDGSLDLLPKLAPTWKGGGELIRTVEVTLNTLPKLPISSSLPVISKIEYQLPQKSVANAFDRLFKTNQNLPVLKKILDKSPVPIYQHPTTGEIYPINGEIPYSPNQVAKLVNDSGFHIPIELISPFFTHDDFKGIDPYLPWIEGDFKRIYDDDPTTEPQYFPNQIKKGLPNPYATTDPNTEVQPIAQLSPQNLPEPKAATQTNPQTSPQTKTTYSNPTGTSTEYTSPTGTPNPVDSPPANPPIPPTIEDDKWKYFDFLPTLNPYSMNPASWMPELPEPSCFYEIHKSFSVPFLGTKHFDLAPCVPLQPLRTVLAWVFSVLTVFAVFFIVFRASSV